MSDSVHVTDLQACAGISALLTVFPGLMKAEGHCIQVMQGPHGPRQYRIICELERLPGGWGYGFDSTTERLLTEVFTGTVIERHRDGERAVAWRATLVHGSANARLHITAIALHGAGFGIGTDIVGFTVNFCGTVSAFRVIDPYGSCELIS